MTPNLVLELPTDQLWNKKNEEQRYAMLVKNAIPGKIYTELTEIPALEYTDDEGNTQTVLPKQDQHQLHNTRGISVEVSENTVKAHIRGIGLFQEMEDGGFQLSERGEQLRKKYAENEEWRPYLAELVVRSFLRTRTLLYYMGQGLALRSEGYQRFTGDQLLVADGVEYGVYHTDIQDFSGTPYDGAYTFAGLQAELQDKLQNSESEPAVEPSDLNWLDDLYYLEYQIVASNFEDGLYVTDQLEQLKKRLMEQIASETVDSQHLTDVREKAEGILEEFDDLEGDRRSITYVPNLLLQANLEDILGPELWAEIEAKTDFERGDFKQLMLRGVQRSEPVGGNIISTTRHSLRLLFRQDLLSEADGDQGTVLIPNRSELQNALSEEQFASLIEEVYQPNDQTFLEAFKTAYAELQTETGWVTWKEFVEWLCANQGMIETEVNDQFLKLEQSGVIEVTDTQMGLRSSPKGPPGYENNPKVVFDIS